MSKPIWDQVMERDAEAQREWERRFWSLTGCLLRDGYLMDDLLCDETFLWCQPSRPGSPDALCRGEALTLVG